MAPILLLELAGDSVELGMIPWRSSDLTCRQDLSGHVRVPVSWLEAAEAEAELRGVRDIEVQVRLPCIQPPESLSGDGWVGHDSTVRGLGEIFHCLHVAGRASGADLRARCVAALDQG